MMRMTGNAAVVPTTIAEAPFMYDALARELTLRPDVVRGGLRVVEGRAPHAASPALDAGSERVRRANASVRDAMVGTRELALAALVVVLCAGALLAWALSGHEALASATSGVSFEQVSVEQGESLWGISEAHPVKGLSTQQVVSLISERNGLGDSVLQPGQTLLVPAMDGLQA